MLKLILVMLLIGMKASAQFISDLGVDIVRGNNKFALNLYQELKNSEGNIFISPQSLSNGLGMVYLMSKGPTADEIANVMQFPRNTTKFALGFRDVLQFLSGSGSTSWANKIFIAQNYSIVPCFTKISKAFLSADIENVNFEDDSENARTEINSWVSNNTNGKISELLNSGAVSSTTKMVLVSAVYFKQNWHNMFNKDLTKKTDFFLSNGSIKEVDMMTMREELGYADVPALNASVVHIPYKEFNQSFVIILPNEKDGLGFLEENLSRINFEEEILDSIDYNRLVVKIPKFELDATYELKETLKKLGIRQIFDSKMSDFSNAINDRNLEISSVYHKTDIELDEEGTEAAAASGFILEKRIDSPKRIIPPFIADHPFVFAIVDTITNTILFLGRFSVPK